MRQIQSCFMNLYGRRWFLVFGVVCLDNKLNYWYWLYFCWLFLTAGNQVRRICIATRDLKSSYEKIWKQNPISIYLTISFGFQHISSLSKVQDKLTNNAESWYKSIRAHERPFVEYSILRWINFKSYLAPPQPILPV